MSTQHLHRVFLITLTCLCLVGAVSADVVYVKGDATGDNNGTSWQDAFRFLQDALAWASAGDEIWVAAHTYRPDETTNDPNGTGNRNATFQLISGVTVYGGFDGTETELTERDTTANITILSGDLTGDDDPNIPATLTENSYHVVTGSGVDATAVLDGFTVRAGMASGPDSGNRGAGMLIVGGSPIVRNCQFLDNRHGDSWPLFGGGAMFNESSSPTVISCVFRHNSGGDFAGGMCNVTPLGERQPVLLRAEHPGKAGSVGAERDCYQVTVIDCLFAANDGHDGGAVYNNREVATQFVNCRFLANTAAYGAGIYNRNWCGTAMVNCAFVANGSAVTNEVPLSLVNCTFSTNGVAVQSGNSSTQLTNCIVWGNAVGLDGAPSVTYSDIQDPNGAVYSGAGNISADPLFIRTPSSGPDESWGTADDDYGDLHIKLPSGCIEAGSNVALPADTYDLDSDGDTTEPLPVDLTGATRVLDGEGNGTPTVDMGAYEYAGPPFSGVLYVKRDTPAGDDGLTWETAFDELRGQALAYAAAGASDVRPVQVWVAAGNYKPYGPVSDPGDPGRARSFVLANNVQLYGGFVGTETALEQRTIPIALDRQTILSGDLLGDDEQPGGTNGENSLRIVTCESANVSTRLDGFIVERGTNTSWAMDPKGAGIYISNASPVVANCTVRWNHAAGAIYGGGGIGIAVTGTSSPLILGCAFYENVSPAAAFLNHGTGVPWLVNCVFSGNHGRYSGTLETYGGNLVNCTFVHNWVDNNEGAVITGYGCDISNCIVWGNILGTPIGISSGSVRYSCVEGGYAGDGNINADPLFKDADGGYELADTDLRLLQGSPCIDAGSDPNVPEWITTDIVGMPRFVDGNGDGNMTVDMGAYEWSEHCPPQVCPGPRVWANPLGGFFQDDNNWALSAPDATTDAVFMLDANYAVTFDADAASKRLIARRGEVTYDFGGGAFRGYDLYSTSPLGALVVAEQADDDAFVTITGNGELYTPFGSVAAIGSADNCNGGVHVTGADTSVFFGGDLCVGCAGTGTLSVTAGASVTSFTAAIADLPGAFGLAQVSDPNSVWDIPFFLVVGNAAPLTGDPVATLQVDSGGTVNVGPGGILVLQNGQVVGDGTINGDVVSIGTVGPGLSPGILTINGEYEQVSRIPGFGQDSGRLVLEVTGVQPGEYDQLIVNGPVKLGGGLFVQCPPGFVPLDELDLPLILAPLRTGDSRFDVGFFPGITGNRFLTVTYPQRGAGDVHLITLPLPGDVDFQNPENVALAGVPNSVAVGKFDADELDDLIVTVPGTSGQPGTAVVLLTRFDPNGAYAPATASYTVGIGPCAAAVGDFDLQPGLDIAVVNSGEDLNSVGDVCVLTNIGGTGTFNPVTPDTTFVVGHYPHGITTADFNKDGLLDLAVANTADDTVQILLGGERGLFTPWPQLLQTDEMPGVFTVDPFDPDNDDDPDIALTCGSGVVTVFVNTFTPEGGLAFNGALNLLVGQDPVQLAAGNLTQTPGRTDLVVVNKIDGTVSIILNTSTGPDAVSFAPAVDLPVRENPVGSLPRSLALLDLDEDDDLDIAVVAKNDQDVVVARVLRNDLSGAQLAFAPAADLDAGTEPVAVAAGDLNGDTKDDLIAVGGATGRSGGVVIRLNSPPPGFDDLDGDGDVDGDDFVLFCACMAGPEMTPPLDCGGADLDTDQDVDLRDLSGFQTLFNPSR